MTSSLASRSVPSSASEAAAADSPSHGLCGLEKLAQVEVHSIFQFLDDHSLLLLARCSTSLYRDGHSPIVWRHRLVEMDLRKSNATDEHSFNFEGEINSAATWSYTRTAEARFHLVVDLNDFKHEPSFLSVVEQLLRVPYISSLVIGGAQYFDWDQFFAGGAGPHLRSLAVNGDNYLNTAFIPLLVESAPNLTSISLGETTQPVREIEVLYSSLASLKSLKSLRLVESRLCSFLPLVTSCHSLTSLTLAHTDLKLSVPQLLRHTLSSSLRSGPSQIEELTFDKLHPLTSPFHDEQLQDDLLAIVQQLPRLKRLRFASAVSAHKLAVMLQIVLPSSLPASESTEFPHNIATGKPSTTRVIATAPSIRRILEVLVTESRVYESEEVDELQEAVKKSAEIPDENQFHVLVKTYRSNIASYFDALGPRFTTQILQQ